MDHHVTAEAPRKLLTGVTAAEVLAAASSAREMILAAAGASCAPGAAAAALCLLRSTATVAQALMELAKRSILSAPVVVAAPQGPADVGSFVGDPTWPTGVPTTDILGFVDIRDILSSFLKGVNVADLTSKKLLERMRLLEEQGRKFGTTQLASLAVLGCDGGFMHLSQAKICLLELIIFGLLDPKSRGMHEGIHQVKVVHRIAFFDATGGINAIITQTDIIRFLSENLSGLGELEDMSLEDLGLVQNNVQSVHPDTSAIAALAQMQELGLSSLAVIGHNGQLIGNFSASDLRCITPQQFGALALPVGEFLALGNQVEYVGHNRRHSLDDGIVGTEGHRFITEVVPRTHPHVPGEDVGQRLQLCQPSDTFGQLISKLATQRIHRVYVIDAQLRPVGIVTCTDVLKKLVEVCSRPAQGTP